MPSIFLADVDVLDGCGALRRRQTIVIRDGRIVAVGHKGEAPPAHVGDEVLSLPGAVVMPGMVSGHFHSSFHNVGAELGLMLLSEPPGYRAYRALANAQLALACGFTTVVSAGCADAIDGQLERVFAEGLWDGPRMVPCSRDLMSSADVVTPWWIALNGEWGVGRCDGPDEVRRTVRSEINRGARLVKLTFSGGHAVPIRKGIRVFNDEEVRVAVETAHALGARVRAHVAGKEAVLAAIRLGVDILDHADDMDDECIDAMIKADVFVLPSLYQTSKLLSADTPFFGIPREHLQAEFDHMCAILPRAAAAGVKLCIGDDFGTSMIAHGEYAHELSIYVDHAGIAPAEVLRWATHNGAGLADIAGLGTISAGSLADLLILKGDPSHDIRVLQDRENITGIISRGKFVSRPDASTVFSQLEAAE